MHLSLLCLIALAIVVPSLGHNEHAYKNGYYFGRSADIVVDDEDIQPVEVQLEWQITKKHNHGVRENVTQVYDVHVYNLVSRALGLPQIHLPKSYSMESQMDDSVPFNFFNPLTGNVLFSIEGLHSETVPKTTKALGASPVYTLGQTSRPYHPMSVLTTVISGTQPRKHGIVNERDITSMTSNLFDVAKALYPDTLLVSGSSAKCFATVLSAHKETDSYYWDSETRTFVALNADHPTVLVNEENIVTHLVSIGFPRKLSFQPGVEAFIGSVSFDAKDEVDTTLFAEVAFVSAWTSFLQQSESQKFFSFHFKSLPLIAEKYGKNSPQWTAAVELIDATVLYSLATLRDCAFEVVYLPAIPNERTKAMQSLVAPILDGFVAEEKFPHIYLTPEGQVKQQELCQKMRQTLSQDYPEATVFCSLKGEEKKRMNQDDTNVPISPVTASIPTVLQFHYVFWTMLVLLVALIWATCMIAYIPPDESLYTASTYYKKGTKL